MQLPFGGVFRDEEKKNTVKLWRVSVHRLGWAGG